MGFPDFEIGKNEVSYVRSDEICDFLNQYADHFQLKKHIKFNTYVIRVVQRNTKWQVSLNVSLNKSLSNRTVCRFCVKM